MYLQDAAASFDFTLPPSLIRFISADGFNQIQLYLFVSFSSADNVSQQQQSQQL